MKCPVCGTQIADDASFCMHCGSRVAVAPAPASIPAPAAPSVAPAQEEVDKPDGGNWKSYFTTTVTAKVNEAAGGTGAVELRYGDFFSSVFKQHSTGEAERIFMCGTSDTTPPISQVSTRWPRPWLFSRVLLLLVVVTALFGLVASVFDNFIGLACFIFFGAMAAPFTVAVFFFECNALRNISFVEVAKVFVLGGTVSILGAVAIESLLPYETLSAGGFFASLFIAIVEEVVKGAVIAFFLLRFRGRNYILSSMLIGAAVAGAFGAFETAGFALHYWNLYGLENSINLILTSSGMAIGRHVAWGAIQGGAFALGSDGRDFSFAQVLDVKCLTFLAASLLLHFFWTFDIPLFSNASSAFGFSSQHAICTAFAWIVISVLLNRGLEQVNRMTGAK